MAVARAVHFTKCHGKIIVHSKWTARHQHIDNSYDTMQVLSHYSSVQIPCSQSGELELENDVTEWKNTLEEHALSPAKRSLISRYFWNVAWSLSLSWKSSL